MYVTRVVLEVTGDVSGFNLIRFPADTCFHSPLGLETVQSRHFLKIKSVSRKTCLLTNSTLGGQIRIVTLFFFCLFFFTLDSSHVAYAVFVTAGLKAIPQGNARRKEFEKLSVSL